MLFLGVLATILVQDVGSPAVFLSGDPVFHFGYFHYGMFCLLFTDFLVCCGYL